MSCYFADQVDMVGLCSVCSSKSKKSMQNHLLVATRHMNLSSVLIRKVLSHRHCYALLKVNSMSVVILVYTI
jgi:hypothetical protein